MVAANDEGSALRRPLRLWPGVMIVVLQWLLWLGLPSVWPEGAMVSVLSAVGGGVLVAVWWLFLSRAAWVERLGAIVLMVAAVAVAYRLVHVSIATAGMGYLLGFYSIPFLSLALVVWAAVGTRLARGPRWAALVVTVLLACAPWALLRTGGFSGDLRHELMWRWSKTPEDRLLAQMSHEVMTSTPVAPPSQARAAWPGFRGDGRDGIVHGTRIATDWSVSPPVELWRRAVGPGWSSFAVDGELFYTQEQRGEQETVACYRVSDGEPVWRHGDPVRFWESNGGAGPRATPTLHEGRVLTLGATGILSALDATTGAVIWSRDAIADTGAKIPGWGISGSPLVVGDVAIVAVSGRLAGYDLATGERRWSDKGNGGSYSSPQLATIGGVEQVLLQRGKGAVSVVPADGTVLWAYEWPSVSIVQPATLPGGDLLLSDNDNGIRRLNITRGSEGWTVEERWTSTGLKPYFNDFVVHEGHAYGFDGSLLAAIDLADGKRVWKGGRYGNGQLILLADQDVLLVISEKGELALVAAVPEGFRELARFPAIAGKTWNHPVLAGDLLLVRNDREMAAFRLQPQER